jgi:hypothetical protein
MAKKSRGMVDQNDYSGTKSPTKFEAMPALTPPPKPRPEPVMPPDPQYPPALVGAFTPSNAITAREPESFVRDYHPAPTYRTPLSPSEEQMFQAWVKQNGVPYQDAPDADYDMRGYYNDIVAKGKESTVTGPDGAPHYPDTYKTPHHETFSNESKYAAPGAPHWDGNVLVDNRGRTLVDEDPGFKQTPGNPFVGKIKAPPTSPFPPLSGESARIFSKEVIEAPASAPKKEPKEYGVPAVISKKQTDAYKVFDESHSRGMPDHDQMGGGFVAVHPDERTRAEWEKRKEYAKDLLDEVESLKKADSDEWKKLLPMPKDLLPYPEPATAQQADVNRRVYEEEVKAALQRLKNEAEAPPPEKRVVAPVKAKIPSKVQT